MYQCMSHLSCFFVLFLTWQYHFWSKSLRCHFIGIPESPKHFESESGISTMELVLSCKTFFNHPSQSFVKWLVQTIEKKRFDKRSKILVPLNCPNGGDSGGSKACDGKHNELNVVLRIHENLAFLGVEMWPLYAVSIMGDPGMTTDVAYLLHQIAQKISLKPPQPRVLGGRAY